MVDSQTSHRLLGISWLIIILSTLSVHYAYSIVGTWPPSWSSILVSFLLAMCFWLLVTATLWFFVQLTSSRFTIQLVLIATTIVAFFTAASLRFGFNNALFIFLSALVVSFFSSPDRKSRWNFRPAGMLIPEIIFSIPSIVIGGCVFLGLHLCGAMLLGLNIGRLEFTVWTVLLTVACGGAGAFCQLLGERATRLMARTNYNGMQQATNQRLHPSGDQVQ